MKIADLKDQSLQQLRGHLTDMRKQQFNLRVQRATGQLEKSHELAKVRRDIARVQTMIAVQRNAQSRQEGQS
ncbi:MAG: 50S ribosomal protein L29 [Pseudomonadota bacterium]